MAAQTGNAGATPVVDCRSGAALEAQAESVAVAKTKQTNARCFILSVIAGMEIALGATLMLFVKSDPRSCLAASRSRSVCCALSSQARSCSPETP